MRSLPYLLALTLPACSAQNPLFGLDTDATDTAADTVTEASAASTTAAPTSAPIPTTGDGPTGDNPDTSASEPATSATSQPGSATDVDPVSTGGDSVASDVDDSSDSDSDSSTGDALCALHKDLDFTDALHVGGVPVAKCFNDVTYFHGKLQAGGGELRFNTSNTGCPGEENDGVLSLGSGYTLAVPGESKCAKLYLYRDGPGPACDIAQFYIIQADPSQPIAVGAFSPTQPAANHPVSLLDPEAELLPCCPAESQGCCEMGMFGDHALNVDGTSVAPGTTSDLMIDGEPVRLANIQSWQTGDCQNKVILGRRDYAAVRL